MTSAVWFLFASTLLVSPFIVSGCRPNETTLSHGPKRVDVDEFARLLDGGGLVLLDVRTSEEFAAGHVPNARNINVQSPTFESEIAGLDCSRGYLVYCRSGRRSQLACELMKDAGFAQLYDLAPGFNGWKAAGRPVE